MKPKQIKRTNKKKLEQIFSCIKSGKLFAAYASHLDGITIKDRGEIERAYNSRSLAQLTQVSEYQYKMFIDIGTYYLFEVYPPTLPEKQ